MKNIYLIRNNSLVDIISILSIREYQRELKIYKDQYKNDSKFGRK
jgi:hypothetical protein